MTLKFNPSVAELPSVTWAQFAPEPTFTAQPRVTGKKRQGINYEKKAQDYVEFSLAQRRLSAGNLQYLRSPWLCYRIVGRQDIFYCQPDGIILDSEQRKLVILEMKLSHTAHAWYQIRKLYQPVLSLIYPDYSMAALEIVRWLDPHVPFPETFKFVDDVVWFDVEKFGVHIFNPGPGR